MPETIPFVRLRNDNAEIMRRVEAGESFVIMRNGKAIADLVPHGPSAKKRKTGRDMQEEFRQLSPIVIEQWYRDRAEADEFFGGARIEY